MTGRVTSNRVRLARLYYKAFPGQRGRDNLARKLLMPGPAAVHRLGGDPSCDMPNCPLCDPVWRQENA